MQHQSKTIALTALLTLGLGGCSSEPEWVGIYEECKQQMSTAAEEMKAKSGDNPQAKAMAEAMGNMVVAMGVTACESIKQLCEPDPDSSTCQTVVQEYKKSKSKE